MTTTRKRALVALVTAVAALLLGAGALSAQPGSSALRQVWVIPIETVITPATAQFVKSRVAQANEAQPLAIVFTIDTPGGQILAAEEIVETILQDARVPTIAVVSNALSAGAIIAMSAEQLVMLPGSSIGAATAVSGLTGQRADEKTNSAWRSFFRTVAEARGRNAQVAEGMVSERVEIPGLSTSSELITLTAAQAVEHGIADLQARSLPDALEQLGYGGAEVVRLEPNLAERLGTALANPLLAALFLVLGIGGVVLEALSPGFGLPGIIGVLALVALGAGLFIATPAGIFDLVLLLGGLLLLLLEVLVIPGFGIAGVLGLAAVVVAVVRVFPNEYAWAYVIGYATIFGAMLLVALFWILPNSRLTRVFALSTRLDNAPGTDPEQARLVASYDYLRGRVGVASSDLRPAGVAHFGDERVDVVSEGEFIPRGSAIEVVRVEGSRVVVRQKAA